MSIRHGMRRAGLPRGGVSPADITGLSLWLDAADSTTLFSAASGGSTPTDGGLVGRWEDKSGLGKDATEPSTSYQPKHRPSALSLGGVSYEALGKKLITGPNTALNTDKRTTFVVGSFNAGIAASAFIISQKYTSGSASPLNNDGIYATPADISTFARGLTSGFYASNLGSFNTNPHVFGQVISAADTVELFVDGTGYGAVAGVTMNPTGHMSTLIGAYYSGSEPVNSQSEHLGLIHEVIIYNNEISVEDRQAIESYLATKWGL